MLHHGVDIERIRALVAEIPELPGVARDRSPELKVLALDERGVHLALFFWITEPSRRLPATDAVNTWLYGHLARAGVSFAVAQHVVHVDDLAALADLMRRAKSGS